MGDFFDFYEGNEATTQTTRGTATGFGSRPARRPQQGSGTGEPDDRTPGSPSSLPTGDAYNAWRQYVKNNHRLEQIWDDENRGTWTTLTHKRFRKDKDKREFDRLQRDIRAYQANQSGCDSGDATSCQAVGRTDRNDRPIYDSNPNSAEAIIRDETGGNATAQDYWNNRRNNTFTSSLALPLETGDTPGDIMGDGTSTAPVDPNASARTRCAERGGQYTTDGGGACIQEAPPVPGSAPHTDDPADRTGEQVPRPEHDDQQHRSAESGGGMHDGSAGSGSNTGSGEVEHFDTGGKPMSNLARQENPVKKMLNLIGALNDPYGQFRRCNTEKRFVE